MIKFNNMIKLYFELLLLIIMFLIIILHLTAYTLLFFFNIDNYLNTLSNSIKIIDGILYLVYYFLLYRCIILFIYVIKEIKNKK